MDLAIGREGELGPVVKVEALEIVEEVELRSLFCRICLKKQLDLVPLSFQPRELSLLEMIQAVTGLELTSEGIVPDRICPACMEKIDMAHNIRQDFVYREQVLRNMLGSAQLEQYYKSYDEDLCSEAKPVDEHYFEEIILSVKTEEPPAATEEESIIEETIIEEIPLGLEVQEDDEDGLMYIDEDPAECDLIEKSDSLLDESLTAQDSVKSVEQQFIISYEEPPPPTTIATSKARQPVLDPLSCNLCNTAQTNAATLLTHLETKHRNLIPYRCQVCSGKPQLLTSIAAINEHFGTHRYPAACEFCPMRFLSSRYLDEHLRQRHHVEVAAGNVSEGYVCGTCGERFTKRWQWKTHEERHRALAEERFKCDAEGCGKLFETAMALKGHRKVHAATPALLPHTCYVCNTYCDDAEALETHLEQHVGLLPFHCQHCSTPEHPQIAKSLVLLNKHLMSHQFAYKCDHCPQRFATDRSKKYHVYHMHSVSSADGYTCAYCGKFFVEKRVFRVHITKHRAKEREAFKCSHCGKAFSNGTLLKRHERIHTGEKPYECKKCGKRFNHKDNWTVHKRKHIEERGHPCGECGKSFFDAVNLRYHMGVHYPNDPRYRRPERNHQNNERLFYCDHEGCSYTATSNSKIYYHRGKHLKQFQCEICLWRWPTNAGLRQHVRTVHEGHRPARNFVCPYCEKKFPNKQKLGLHVDVHEDNRRYKCQFCDKGFVQQSNCAAHERTHTGEKPYGCRHCSAHFNTSTTRKKHEVAFHIEAVQEQNEADAEEVADGEVKGRSVLAEIATLMPEDRQQQELEVVVEEDEDPPLYDAAGMDEFVDIETGMEDHKNGWTYI